MVWFDLLGFRCFRSLGQVVGFVLVFGGRVVELFFYLGHTVSCRISVSWVVWKFDEVCLYYLWFVGL